MTLRFGVCLTAVFALIQPQSAVAQWATGPSGFELHAASMEVQQERRFGEKSPALAGILSFLLFPGTGSFYAGNSSHGVRHVVIAGGTLIGMVAGLSAACDDGFDLCDEESAGYVIGGISALGYFINWIWGGVTAIGDANAYNRDLRASALRLAPGVVRLTTSLEDRELPLASPRRVGIQVMRIAF